MPFLSLNGFTMEVAINNARRRVTSAGKRRRAYRGQMRDGTRGNRRELKLRTCFHDHEEAQAMIHLVNGEGHVVYFREGWDAATGLSPVVEDLSNCRFDRAETPFPGYEPGSFRSESDQRMMTFDAQLKDDWTLHGWVRIDGEVWEPYTRTSDGCAYVAGVRDDTLWDNTWGNYSVDVLDGRLHLMGNGGDITWLHHLCLLPWVASEEMVLAWHAATKPWGPMPLLRVEGDLITSSEEFMLGRVDDVTFITKPHDLGAPFGWVNNAEIIDLTLMEYRDGYVADDQVAG